MSHKLAALLRQPTTNQCESQEELTLPAGTDPALHGFACWSYQEVDLSRVLGLPAETTSRLPAILVLHPGGCADVYSWQFGELFPDAEHICDVSHYLTDHRLAAAARRLTKRAFGVRA